MSVAGHPVHSVNSVAVLLWEVTCTSPQQTSGQKVNCVCTMYMYMYSDPMGMYTFIVNSKDVCAPFWPLKFNHSLPVGGYLSFSNSCIHILLTHDIMSIPEANSNVFHAFVCIPSQGVIVYITCVSWLSSCNDVLLDPSTVCVACTDIHVCACSSEAGSVHESVLASSIVLTVSCS